MASTSPKPYSLKKLSGFLGDDPAQVVEMIHLFLETIPPELNLLKQSASDQNYENVATVAHRIKPSIDVFDLQLAMQVIRRIELFCRDIQKQPEVPALVEELTDNLLEALELMKMELD